jgi:hypothetical protein
MKKFADWFDNNLKVSRFPMPNEIERSEYDYIINVSDEYIPSCHIAAMASNKKYFWFPMNEISGDMGINSIYGALQILSIAEEENAKVYLHCHAGANRSPTVADAYFFMRTGKHREVRKVDGIKINFELSKGEESKSSNNRILNNINNGNLPAKNIMERFLNKCSEAFQKDLASKGGMIDWCKINSRF